MSKLKNENNMREFSGISREYSEYKDHFIFKNLRNAGPKLYNIHKQMVYFYQMINMYSQHQVLHF
jgi:hypothetical protein